MIAPPNATNRMFFIICLDSQLENATCPSNFFYIFRCHWHLHVLFIQLRIHLPSSIIHLPSYIFHLLSFIQMWFIVNAIDSKVSSRFFGVSSHSHTVMQCQPIAASFFCSSLSRSLFHRIFATQKSRFVFGILQHFELSTFHFVLSTDSKL